jgi:endoribonuclease LACTB2
MSVSRPLTPLALIGRRGPRLQRRELAPGLAQLRLWTRASKNLGFVSTPYLLDEVLVDTGFAHVRSLVLGALADVPLRAICLTHHHEDHPGNAGPLAERHGCPVYLHDATAQWSEGVARLPAYRRMYWGRPAPYQATEMPSRIDTGARILRVVPTPGHSATHVALFDESEGHAFVGDLYVAPGVSALMPQENPYELARSLRRVAELDPASVLNGHGLVIERPARALREKAEAIEAAALRAVEGRARGLSLGAIEHNIWRNGWRKDRMFRLLTGGEFRRRNFVRAALRFAEN